MKTRILIGLALAGLALLGVVGSASASQLKAEKYPATVSGGLDSGVFSIVFEGGIETKCASAEWDGELSAAQESLTANSILGSCVFATGFTPINMNGCDWVFGTGAGSEDAYAGTLGISCPAGKAIVIAAVNCEVQIPAQSGLTGVAYENLTTATPKSKVAMDLNVSGLTYNKTKDGFLCPLSGTGTLSDGVLTASVTLAGKEKSGANALGIKVE